ncbi:hypothetical protein ACE1OE_19455 [Vibrio sp. E150_011]
MLISTQTFALNQIEVSAQIQRTHLIREYESSFLINNENTKSHNGLDAKIGLLEVGISIPVYRGFRAIGTISIGDDNHQNILWISQYSLDNNIGTQPNHGGYNEYSDGHLKYKNYRVGIEQQTTNMLTTGIYLAKEEVDSRSDTLHASSIPATTYFEESFKLEGYSEIHTRTPLNGVSVGIQNIITLRRSSVNQSFWYQGNNNWVSFNAPSIQLLSSPYMLINITPGFFMRMSLTHTVFKGLKQKDVEFESTSLAQISDVGIDAYSGSQTNVALNASYCF